VGSAACKPSLKSARTLLYEYLEDTEAAVKSREVHSEHFMKIQLTYNMNPSAAPASN